MTKKDPFRSIVRDALRRSGGFAPFAYYYFYFSARAEPV